PPSRIVQIEQDVLAKNSRLAERNRGWLEGRGILAWNLMSSPGAGKTTLLECTIRDLGAEIPLSVIEGDQATLRDAARIRAAGWPGGADQHRPRALSRCGDAARGPAPPRPPDALRADDRDRRQPRVPGALRPRRAHEARDHVGDRGRGQAAQVPAHVPRQRR